jgi:hypothetical protein
MGHANCGCLTRHKTPSKGCDLKLAKEVPLHCVKLNDSFYFPGDDGEEDITEESVILVDADGEENASKLIGTGKKMIYFIHA